MWFARMWEVLVLGLKNLLRNKLRSFLTMLGMIFGVGSVIAMLSVGAGARHEILTRIQELGVRNIILNSVKPPEEVKPDSSEQTWRVSFGLTFEDAEAIDATVPAVDRILRVNRIKKRAWYGSKRLETSVLGVEPEYLRMFNLEVGAGRPFNETDARDRAKVCLVRRGLIRQLETIEDPVGMWLLIGDFSFQIIGVLADEQFRSHTRKALAIDGRAQEVYIPYSTSMRTFGTITHIERSGSSEYSQTDLDQIVVTTKESDDVFPTARVLDALLTHHHDRRDFEIVVPMELMRQRENTQKVFSIVMILIASISLLVGGIGIANIMLATITERTKEIGIRRACGARRRDIVVQFLTETTAIAAIGGLFGCLFGIAGTLGIVEFTQWKALIAPHYVGISLVISCTVGILFGIFPARRAALMDPITALRRE
ncbi:MAG: FtsX-like permease family protein [bacterium]|nr:FtsX-like permease family protein [bacterium]